MAISPLSNRVSATAPAKSMVLWLKEHVGDLVFVHTTLGDLVGEVTWCRTDHFIQKSDHLYWDEISGCAFYVRRRDINYVRQGGIKLDLAFENGEESNAFRAFRFVTFIRPFTDDEAIVVRFAEDQKAADTAAQLMKKLAR